MNKMLLAGGTILMTLLSTISAYAAQPTDWQWTFQPAGSDLMQQITDFGTFTFYIIGVITVFVMVLLAWIVIRYNKRANPTASKTSHNTLIEIIWTVVPVLILLAIAIPSFRLLDNQFTPPTEPTVTIKATGFQWYWGYEYQDGSEVSFDSLMLQEEDRADAAKEDKAKYPRLLAVDNEMVVPVGETIRVLVTSEDVIHDFALPAFGIKMDAIPLRMNETWFKAREVGIYYGQCSELCGKDHAFMPVAIRVVTRGQYDAWLIAAKDDVDVANKALVAAVKTDSSVKIAANAQ